MAFVADEYGGSGPALTPISVDLDRLTDFARMLRTENDANLEPYAARIAASHSMGVHFAARSPSNEMQAARRQYQACLDHSVTAMRDYVATSQQLVQAIEQVVRQYQEADNLSSARSNELAASLYGAWDAKSVRTTATADTADPAGQGTPSG